MQDKNEVKIKKDKKSKKLPKWLNFGYIALAIGASVLLFLCSVLLYK